MSRNGRRNLPYAFAFVLNDKQDRLFTSVLMPALMRMLLEGLVAEVEKLKEKGCHRGMVSMQGLGYKEILEYLDGECTPWRKQFIN